MRTNKGFTIIELLIVIVIIGILVAITAISYTGITNSANTTKSQANARSVKQVVTACYSKDGTYPTVEAVNTSSCGSGMTLPSGVTVTSSNPAENQRTTEIKYTPTDGKVYYYDYSTTDGGFKEI